MKRGTKPFYVSLGGACQDCLCRESRLTGLSLTIEGLPRRHPWYGRRLSEGCEGCGGTGVRSVMLTNIEDILAHPTSRKLQHRLTPRQRFVIELRLGLRDGNCYTLREIGKYMGLAHQTVHEIEQAARKKLERLAYDPYAQRGSR